MLSKIQKPNYGFDNLEKGNKNTDYDSTKSTKDKDNINNINIPCE